MIPLDNKYHNAAGVFTITRNAQNGLPLSVSDSIFTNARTFNAYGEIGAYSNKIGAADVYTLSMTRDNSGRITQKIENIKGEVITWDYGYDRREKGSGLAIIHCE